MSDDFENKINQRMQDFRITPGPQIWERVAAALPPEKRRRRFAIWWWLLPLAACLGGGIWLGIRKPNKPANAPMQKMATQTPVTENHYQPIEENTTDDVTKNDKKQTTVDVEEAVPYKKETGTGVKQLIPDKQEVTAKQLLVVNKKKKTARKVVNKEPVTYQPANEYLITKTTIDETQNSLLKRHTASAGNADVELDNILHTALGNIRLQKAAMPDSIFVDKQSTLPVSDLVVEKPQEIVSVKDSSAAKKEDTLTTAFTQKQLPSAKRTISKTAWSLVVAAGSSNLNGGIKNENKSAQGNFSTGVTGSVGNSSRQFTDPTAGFTFGAGIVRRQAISKHWTWQAAFYYQFLTSHQYTGASNDSLLLTQTFADAAYNAVRFTGSTTGTASTIGTKRTNQVHRLQIVPGVQFTINPSSKSPLSFSAGATIDFNLGNHLLLHDYRSYSYIRSSKFSNKLMIGTEVGMDIFINRKIHAGIFFTHDFTNVAKPQLLSSFHWNQLQLRVGFPLFKNK